MQVVWGNRRVLCIRKTLTSLVCLLLILTTRVVVAQTLTVTPSWPGGIELSGNRVGFSSPVVAELDGNPANGKEVVVASLDGTVYAYHTDGTLLWQTATPDSGCGGPARINSSPAIGPLYGDGSQYVVVGYGAFEKRCNGGVIAFHGIDGSIAWNFSTLEFAKKEKFGSLLHAVFSSPALADTDGDGKMEIGFGSFDRNVYLLNYDGTIRWYYTAADTVWSSPAFANLDQDSNLEMIIGTDISQNKRLKPVTANGGNLYAFKTKKNPNRRFGFRDKKAFLWMKPLDQTLFSSPAVGDVLAESPGPEVVINSGCYFPANSNQKTGKWIKVFRGSNGALLQTIPIEACSPSSPALADIDGDGIKEIVVTVNGSASVGGDGSSHIEAFKASSTTPLWNIIPTYKGRNYEYGGNFISPSIADVNRDGRLEVVAPVASGVGIYDALTGNPLTCQSEPCAGLPALGTADILLNSVSISDLDGDGNIDIIAAGKHSSGNGGIYRWKITSSAAIGLDASDEVPWGMFRKNSSHTGF